MQQLKKHKNILIESAAWAIAAPIVCYLAVSFSEIMAGWI